MKRTQKQDWEIMVDQIAESYIKVMGREKWDNLTDTQKHDAVMHIVKDLLRRTEKIKRGW